MSEKAIRLIVDRANHWGWIDVLAARMERNGWRVDIEQAPRSEALGTGFDALEALERTVFGFGQRHFATRQDPLTRPSEWNSGDSLDLTGHEDSVRDALILRFGGAKTYAALIAALLDGYAPPLTLERNGRVIAQALPAVDDYSVLGRALDGYFAATVAFIVQSLTQAPLPTMSDGFANPIPSRLNVVSLAAAASRTLATKIIGRIASVVSIVDHWQVGYRLVEHGLWQTGNWSGPAHKLIKDDRKRFYADPFAIHRDGKHFVFVEEYPYATRKGIISVAEIMDGRASTPVPVIETAYHMSYPFVFEHGDAVFMIPETLENRTVELWTADAFPNTWSRVTTLLSDVDVVDATLHFSQDGVWLFAGVRPEGASACHELGIWFADRLLGPYRRVPGHISDARCARPAGSLKVIDGTLWRPAQDCQRRYGGAIALCKIEELDESKGFSQRIGRVIEPPPGSYGVHTLNVANGLEVVDICSSVMKDRH